MNIRVNTPLKHGGEVIPAGTVIAPGVIELSERDSAALVRARAIEPTKDDPSPGYEGETKAKNTNTQGRSGTAREAPSTDSGTPAGQETDQSDVGVQPAAHSIADPVQPADQADKPKRGGKKSES